MTTMLSLILAFMLTIGGSPADVVNPSGCLEASYIQALVDYGNGIDERIEIERREKNQDGNYEWKSYLPLHDSIGNVTALTNDKGHLIERYNYSPYGEVTYFNTESAPGIDYVRIKDGVIRIKFDRPVDPGKIYIHLYIKSTQQVISGNKEYIDIEEIGYRTSTLPTDEMLTLNLKNQSGPGAPIDIFSQDFIYQGQTDVIVHDGGKPYVKKEVQVENNIVIIFNEEIDSNAATYEVELEKNNIKIDGTLVRTGANEYKFFPSGGLVKDAAYKLRMSGFKDLLGNAMDDLEHSFVSTYNNTLIFEASILTANNHSIVGNTSLLHGRDYEPEVGLYYYRNRYYHPQLGRFLQQDPMGYEDSQNLYQAFNQNPVNFTDPMGLQSFGNWFPNHPYNKKFPGSRSIFDKAETGFKEIFLTSRRVGVSVANATAGNAVNVVIFLATANPIGWAAGERPALVFYSDEDPYSTQLVSGKFMIVDAKPLEDIKNATIVIPMIERTVDYMKNMCSDSPEAAKYCQLNVAQFGMDLYCLSEMGGGLLNLNKGKVIQQYKTESGGTCKIVEIPYDRYAGVKEASKLLIDEGVPREYRVEALQSFEIDTIKVRKAGANEYGIRFYDNIDAFPKGRTLFETFPASREGLAVKWDWNKMYKFKQFKIREGAWIVEGRISSQGKGLPGGLIQKYILDPLRELIE
jgi:RHS repeat-associated protein